MILIAYDTLFEPIIIGYTCIFSHLKANFIITKMVQLIGEIIDQLPKMMFDSRRVVCDVFQSNKRLFCH